MLTVLLGEVLLFHALRLLVYGGVIALKFHLFALAAEEPTLARTFGEAYEGYGRKMRRWRPRPPQD